MVLILSRKDVQLLVNMDETIEVMAKVFLELHQGKVILPKRVIINVDAHKGFMYYMPSYLSEGQALAVKVVSQYEENLSKYGLPTIQATVLLSDPRDGKLLALIEGAYLTALRTGAASGLAARYLARRDSRVVSVIGTGVQARTQIWALSRVFGGITRITAYDLVPRRVEDFAKEISEKLGLDVETARTGKECVENSDVLVIATTSRTPVLNGNWLKSGAHVISIGVPGPEGRELDDITVRRAKIVVDTTEGVLTETGDLNVLKRDGIVPQNHVYAELHEIVGGDKPGRTSNYEITCWKAVGLAIEDAAVAKLVYDKAKKEGVGEEVEI